jgi:hypothetical protein
MGCLSVSLNLSGRESEQRLEVCTAAFHEAELDRIDEIRLEPSLMERPPPDVEAAVQALLRDKASRWGRVKIRGPSRSVMEASLRACPYLKSVALFTEGRMLVGVADAADTIDFTVKADRWPAVRRQLIQVLGSELRVRTDELRDC